MPKYRMFAAIELGSSAIVMKIAQMSKSRGAELIDSVKYNISLGSEVYRNGKISYATVEEICLCLERCMSLIGDYGVSDYECYATTAMREAANNDYVIDRIGTRCGIAVDIISNAEEMFLHNKAFALNNPYFDEIIAAGAVIIDVNSGNTQVSFYDKSMLKFSQGMQIGSSRVLEILGNVSGAPVGFSGLLEEYIRMKIDDYKSAFFDREKFNEKNFAYIALTGAQSAVIRRISASKDGKLTQRESEELYRLLKEGRPQEICEKYGISYDDAELLYPTALIYKMFASGYSNKTVIIPEISTADGMCVEFAEKNGYTHTRHIFTNDILSSAKSCAERFGVKEEHYKKTAEYAEVIFNAMAKKSGLMKKDMLLLRLAAIFADTGKYININGYTSHSYEIVNSNPILGISQKDRLSIAYTVLFAEGTAENDEYKHFLREDKIRIAKFAAILAVARALDAAHKGRINEIKASVNDDILKITAYTKSDITMEKLEFERMIPFFKEVFGINAVINTKKQ